MSKETAHGWNLIALFASIAVLTLSAVEVYVNNGKAVPTSLGYSFEPILCLWFSLLALGCGGVFVSMIGLSVWLEDEKNDKVEK